jgi:hypothetical protein
MAVAATFSLSNTGVLTVTLPGHGLVATDSIYLAFLTSSSGVLPTDGTKTVASSPAPTTDTFVVSLGGTPTAATGTLSVSPTYIAINATSFTVKSPAHGLLVGQKVFADLLSVNSGPQIADGTYTVASVTNAATFTLSGITYTSAGTTNGLLNWLDTGGTNYNQSGKILTLTFLSPHGFGAGSYCQLDFIGGAYTKSGNYLITGVPDASTLTVTALTSQVTSGGCRVTLSTALFSRVVLGARLAAKAKVRALQLRVAAVLGTQLRARAKTRRTALEVKAKLGAVLRAAKPAVHVRLLMANIVAGSKLKARASVSYPFFVRAVLGSQLRARGRKSLPTRKAKVHFTGAAKLLAGVTVDRGHETVTSLLDASVALLGYSSFKAVALNRRQPFIDVLNKVLQTIYGQAKQLDYFNQVTRTITVPATVGEVTLPTDVQAVDAFIRIHDDQRQLHVCDRMSDLNQFVSRYLPSTADLGMLYAAYVNRTANPSSPSGFTTVLQFTPKLSQDTVVDINVSLCAPRYSLQDYAEFTPLALPQDYAQSIATPLVRLELTSFVEFRKPEMLPSIQAAADRAREQLGLIDPKPENETPKAKNANKS